MDDLKRIILSERSQTQTNTYYRVHLNEFYTIHLDLNSTQSKTMTESQGAGLGRELTA